MVVAANRVYYSVPSCRGDHYWLPPICIHLRSSHGSWPQGQRHRRDLSEPRCRQPFATGHQPSSSLRSKQAPSSVVGHRQLTQNVPTFRSLFYHSITVPRHGSGQTSQVPSPRTPQPRIHRPQPHRRHQTTIDTDPTIDDARPRPRRLLHTPCLSS